MTSAVTYMASPDFVFITVIYRFKLCKMGRVWPRLKRLCLGAYLWVDLWSHNNQPEWSTITQPATVRCLSRKQVMKYSNRQKLREVFHLQVRCLCFKTSLQGKQNLVEAYSHGLPVIWSTDWSKIHMVLPHHPHSFTYFIMTWCIVWYLVQV